MTPDAVMNYLKQHPEFFEDHADFFSTMLIPHPLGGRAISISERQILKLRERCKQLEGKLRELIEFGKENDAIGEKVHRLTLALMAARDVETVISTLYYNLREDFAVPHTVLRLWDVNAQADTPELGSVGAEARAFAESLLAPYCSTHAVIDTGGWFGEQASLLRSYAYITLKGEHVFGLLALASEDGHRFYPEMGTLYLKRLGELTGAALQRFLA